MTRHEQRQSLYFHRGPRNKHWMDDLLTEEENQELADPSNMQERRLDLVAQLAKRGVPMFDCECDGLEALCEQCGGVGKIPFTYQDEEH